MRNRAGLRPRATAGASICLCPGASRVRPILPLNGEGSEEPLLKQVQACKTRRRNARKAEDLKSLIRRTPIIIHVKPISRNGDTVAPALTQRLLASIEARLVLPSEEPPSPITYTPGLVGYVGVVIFAAIILAAIAWRPISDPFTLLVGIEATAGLSAFAVRTISGVSAAWSASVFVHLGMTLCLGPPGAVAAAIGDGLIGRGLVRAGWFRCIFNTATFTLSSLSAWSIASRIPYQQHPALAPLAGMAAGGAAWLVNHVLVAIVIRLASGRQARLSTSMRSSLAVLPYELAYGWAAAGVALLYREAGTAGFTMLLAPVVAGQAFLVLLARRTHAHQQELREAEAGERRRIARDLHDTVVQVVAGSAMTLAAQAELSAAAISRERVKETAEHLRDAARDLRTLIVQIAPPTLERDGLAVTLSALLKPLAEAGVAVHLECPDIAPAIEDSELIYRVAQEALRNISAHAAATTVELRVAVSDEHVTLLVIDDGRGFSPADLQRRRQEGHVGTRGLVEVATERGATLTVDSQPGRGTRLCLTIPNY